MLPYQIFAVVETKTYPTSKIMTHDGEREFATPAAARAALDELLAWQLARGFEDGLASWLAADKGEMPPSYPDIKWYEWRDGATTGQPPYQLLPTLGVGEWAPPINGHWGIQRAEPNTPGWTQRPMVSGSLLKCVRWAIANCDLDLDDDLTEIDLNKDVLKALLAAPADRYR
jgi:hypothetical protein